jgi:predicted transport protein
MAISVSYNDEIFEQVVYSREDEFEQLVVKNAGTIFGDKAVYIDAKKKIKTSALGGTIPDGFLIDLSDIGDPQFYLVEVELQNHDFFKHIFPQITRFFAFYKDSKQRHKLIDTIFAFLEDNFAKDMCLAEKLLNIIKSNEVYKFLKDTIDSNQNILIIIDGPKPEFTEIMSTYADTWGKMVKVQIVSHFRRNNNHIITVEPPFQNLPFEDAVSLSPDKETSGPSQYTEEFHLQDRQPQLVEIYRKLKQEFINAKNTLRFSPTRNYIGVVDAKRIVYIMVQKKKIRLVVLMAENEVRGILCSGHHKVVSISELDQPHWGGKNPNCAVNIYDTDHWDEIQKLVTRLVVKHQET